MVVHNLCHALTFWKSDLDLSLGHAEEVGYGHYDPSL